MYLVVDAQLPPALARWLAGQGEAAEHLADLGLLSASDEEIVPLQSRIESVADEADLEDVYDTERHLLYVACTRERERLLVNGVEPGSEFLADLQEGSK